MLAKLANSYRVEGYSIVLDVSCQLDTKASPKFPEFISAPHRTAPIIHFLELRPETFPNCFHFWDNLTALTATKVKSESQEIKSTLFVALACLYF